MHDTKQPRNTVGVGDRTLGPDPVLVGVLNVTPDSFSDGGDFLDPAEAASHAAALRGDPRMARVVAEARCPVVLMHMLGEPRTMQRDPRYADVVREVRDFLAGRAEHAVAAGVEPESIILDPGIGFGKALEHNLALLNHLDSIVELGFLVLVGASRKSFIGKITGVGEARERIPGTVAAHVIACARGATFFRVHDVRANWEALALTWAA